MASMLAARLSDFAHCDFAHCVLIVHCVCPWSNSQIVLYWIASQKKLVSEIQSISTNWKYCSLVDNSADLLTRAISALSSLATRPQWPTWNPLSEALLIKLQMIN